MSLIVSSPRKTPCCMSLGMRAICFRANQCDVQVRAKAEKAKAKAKAKSKAKAKPKSCKHLDYTRAGSNQYQQRKRCKDCGVVFEITCTPLVGSD